MTHVMETTQARVDPKILLDLYEKMLRVYFVEERVKIFSKQNKCAFVASSRGHEKLQIATAMLLKRGKDWFFPYYREKALMVGLEMSLKDIFLGMLSRETDPNSRGRNMSEHFSSKDLRIVSPTACTGTQFLPAVGMAKAIREDGRDEIVYVSSGEGATSEGEFFEALNWASRESLPVLFVIQNNGFAISVPQEVQTHSEVYKMGLGFGMRSIQVDGTRFTKMYTTLAPLVQGLRSGEGPLLVEAHVVRLDSHSSSDDQTKYRTPEEIDEVRKHDPLKHTELQLLSRGTITEKEVADLRARIEAEVTAAADEADGAPEPDPAHVLEDIYSRDIPVTVETPCTPVSDVPVAMVDAINHGLREEMERNPRIVMWGEDIADPKGGVFGVTRGLGARFPGRVVNSPLAEASIVGVAQGLAIGGFKPVIEIQFGDYSFPGYMQMRNEIPTLRWRSAGAWSCPMVVRVAVGGYIRGGPFHSQCIESLYAHSPGWYIAFPSNAADAKGLIKTACRMDDPVLFLEHKGLYRQVYSKSPEPGPSYLIPFGKARIAREGTDATIVTWGSTVSRSLTAAARLEEEGASVEVVDIRTIVPLDEETILASARKTGRVLVAHEAILTVGFGGEIAARVADGAFAYLDAPVKRIAALDTFCPFAPSLESAVLPSADDVTNALRDLLAY
jgi:2-oxoisovalerate dehydrogenase E1 component